MSKKERKSEARVAATPATPRYLIRKYAVLALAATIFITLGAWLLREKRGRSFVLNPRSSPDVLLISIDTLRADHLGAFGARVATPTLDRLANEGVVFERTVSHVPITLPSHASILTGTYPIFHGVRDNGSFRLGESQKTLAKSFKAAGYQTAAFVGSFALDSRFGLDQGFELYDDFYGDTSDFNDFAISERPADAVLKPATAWLKERSQERWFAFIHLYDPHLPYQPPPAFRAQYSSDPYTGEVAYTDDALGRFFSDLRGARGLDNTVILVTSDHGEGLGDHAEKTHGMFAYESTMHVPLILHWSGVFAPGLRVPVRVRLIDIAPTLIELAGLPPESSHQGESLVPLIRSPRDPSSRKPRDSYFETLSFNLNRNWAPLTGLYRDRYKYIDLPIPELYDLQKDPKEMENLAETNPGLMGQLGAELTEFVNARSTEASRAIQTAEVDAETEARLGALGYVVGTSSAKKPPHYTPDDDPKRLVVLSDMLDQGIAAHVAGRSEEAIQIFQEILKRRPNFTNVHVNLAYVLHETRRLQEAIAVLEQAVKLGLTTRTLLGRLGLYLQEAGRLKESVALLEHAIEEDSTHAEAYNYLAISYARMGRVEDAVRSIDQLLKLDPSYASAYSNLGAVYLGAKRYPAAEENFKRALQIDPKLATAWNGLGVACASAGRREDAIFAWKRSVELDSRQYDTLYNLGILLTQLNRFAEAIPYLDQFVRTAPAERYGGDLPKVKRLMDELRGKV